MTSENTSDKDQAKALNKTDVSGCFCCGIFPTNDCRPCSYYQSQIKKDMKKSEILKVIKENDIIEVQIPQLYTKLNGYEQYKTGIFVVEYFKYGKLFGRKKDDVFTKILVSEEDLNTERFRIIKINETLINAPYRV